MYIVQHFCDTYMTTATQNPQHSPFSYLGTKLQIYILYSERYLANLLPPPLLNAPLPNKSWIRANQQIAVIRMMQKDKRPICPRPTRGSILLSEEQRARSTHQRDGDRLAKWPSVCVYLQTPDVIGIALISCHHLFGLRVDRDTKGGDWKYRGGDHFIVRV